jgi:uncharacterized protein (TIGR02285 family)
MLIVEALMRLIIYVALILQVAHVWAETSANNRSEEQSNKGQRLIWSIIPYPPIYILEGEYKGQGVADKYLTNAQKFLTGYAHSNELMTPARAWYLISQGQELVCHPSSLKTLEREKFAYFSEAALITPVVRVLMRKTDWQQRLKSANNMNIADYINLNNGIFGIVSQRSYGEKIDRLLVDLIASGKQVTQTSGEQGSRQLYEMLVRGRIDMMLEYPWVSAYFNKTLKDQTVEVVNLEIADFPRYTPAYVACTRNSAGKALITKLNHFIQQTIVGEDNRHRMTNWLDEKEAADYEKDYLEYFKIAH